MPRFTTLPLAALLFAACGCSGLSDWSRSINPFADPFVVADAENPAVEVACIWQPGEGRNGQGIPARGFSGQVFFFSHRDAEPVLVDGTVRIYLFADQGTPEERATPIQQFDFLPEAWSAHATMTSLGPGYSVFVPYPGSEPYQVRCQLRARFTPKTGGPPIWSEAVSMVLDGPPPPGAEPSWWANVDRSVSPPTVASYEITHRSGTLAQLNAEQQAAEPARTLRTDTFRIGEVRPIAYETPARPEPPTTARPRLAARPAPEILDELGTLPSSPPRHEQEARRSHHPLRDVSADVPTLHHPLSADAPGMPTGPETDQSPSRFRLRNESPTRDATSSAMMPGGTDASAIHPLAALADPNAGMPAETTGEPAAASTVDASAAYGVWHPLAE